MGWTVGWDLEIFGFVSQFGHPIDIDGPGDWLIWGDAPLPGIFSLDKSINFILFLPLPFPFPFPLPVPLPSFLLDIVVNTVLLFYPVFMLIFPCSLSSFLMRPAIIFRTINTPITAR